MTTKKYRLSDTMKARLMIEFASDWQSNMTRTNLRTTEALVERGLIRRTAPGDQDIRKAYRLTDEGVAVLEAFGQDPMGKGDSLDDEVAVLTYRAETATRIALDENLDRATVLRVLNTLNVRPTSDVGEVDPLALSDYRHALGVLVWLLSYFKTSNVQRDKDGNSVVVASIPIRILEMIVERIASLPQPEHDGFDSAEMSNRVKLWQGKFKRLKD